QSPRRFDSRTESEVRGPKSTTSRHRGISGNEVLAEPSCPTIPHSEKKQKRYEVKITSENK
ncbi:hypothetical protein A2U01_0096723, partial [Trifolium medium]|nr:hypothetical protein [Trifolium medium]